MPTLTLADYQQFQDQPQIVQINYHFFEDYRFTLPDDVSLVSSFVLLFKLKHTILAPAKSNDLVVSANGSEVYNLTLGEDIGYPVSMHERISGSHFKQGRNTLRFALGLDGTPYRNMGRFYLSDIILFYQREVTI